MFFSEYYVSRSGESACQLHFFNYVQILFKRYWIFLINSDWLKNNDLITKKTTNMFVINNIKMKEKYLLITLLA